MCNNKLGKLKKKFDEKKITYRNQYFDSVITNRGDFLAPIFGDMNVSIVRQKITKENHHRILRFLNLWMNEGDNKYYIPKLYECEFNINEKNEIDLIYYSQSAIYEDITYKINSQT